MYYREYGYGDAAIRETAKAILPRILPWLKAGDKVLDLGCGNGSVAAFLANRGFEVTGADFSATGISQAQTSFPGVRFIQADVCGDLTGLGAGKFNAIISTEVIEHLYFPDVFLKNCFSLLKEEGLLLLSTPYHGFLKNLALSLCNGWDVHFNPSWEGGHIKFWSYRTLTSFLRQHGFRILLFSGIGRVPFLWRSMVICAQKPRLLRQERIEM